MPRLRPLRATTNRRLCATPGLWVLPTARGLSRRDRRISLLPQSPIRVPTETLASEPALAMPALAMHDWSRGRDEAIPRHVGLTNLLAGTPSRVSTTAEWSQVHRGEH